MTTTTAPRTFLDALLDRDFERLATCLHHDVQMRALLPSGHRDLLGSGAITAQFATWFGGSDELEVLDATIDDIGSKVHLQWRLRVLGCPRGPGWHVLEQQAFATGADTIETLDLLCSGFQPEPEASRPTATPTTGARP